MTMIDDLRKTVADRTPVYALVGATDVLVGRARQLGAAAGAQVLEKVHQVRRDADHKTLQAMAQQLPSRAVDSGLHLVARAEETYEDLAERGAQLLSRRREAKSPTPTEPQVRRPAVVIEPPAPAPSPAKPPTSTTAAGASTASSATKPAAPKARKAAAKPRVTKPATAKAAPKSSKAQPTAKTEPAKPLAD